jgi:ureidoacrylate peracid hydrolase
MDNPNVSPATIKSVLTSRGSVEVFTKLQAIRTALVVIDMQNFFMEPGQMLEMPAARAIVPNINLLATTLRKAGGTVAWVNMTLDEQALDAWSVFIPINGSTATRPTFASLQSNTHVHDLWPELQTEPSDLFVNKSRFSAFIEGSSNLKELLDARNIDTLLVVGTLTNVCCESTARDAMMLNFRVVMVEDANATFNEQAHRATLDTFLMFFGDVRTTKDMVSLISRS